MHNIKHNIAVVLKMSQESNCTHVRTWIADRVSEVWQDTEKQESCYDIVSIMNLMPNDSSDLIEYVARGMLLKIPPNKSYVAFVP